MPDNVTPVLEGTTPDQYKPSSSFSLAARRMTITLDDLANSGPGSGLTGVIALEWLEVTYQGPIARRTAKPMRDYIRSIQFMKSISGMGNVTAGGAISSANVDVSISNVSVDEMGAPARIVAMAVVSITVEPKTPIGDAVSGVLRVPLDPHDPASFTITYDPTRKDRFVLTPD